MCVYKYMYTDTRLRTICLRVDLVSDLPPKGSRFAMVRGEFQVRIGLPIYHFQVG